MDTDPGGRPYAAGELIVTYKPGTPVAAERAVANARGVVSKKDLPEIEARVLSLPRVKN